MHSREGKGRVSGRIYRKWVERPRESFHLVLAMLAVMMYILSKMLRLPMLEAGADILFILNMVLYIIQWNQNRIYQFSNLSRHVKGIPAQKLRMINGMYLLVILLLIAGVSFVIMMLPLGTVFDWLGKWLYTLISCVLGALLGRSESGGTVRVDRDMRKAEGFDAAAGSLTDHSVLDFAGRGVLAAGCAVGVLFLAVCLISLYQMLWKRICFKLDEDVVLLEREELVSPLKNKLQAVRRSLGHGIEERIRRNYRRYVRRRMKKGSILNQAWTPAEIEEFIGMNGRKEDGRELCALYEKARYGDHASTSEDLERSFAIIKKS